MTLMLDPPPSTLPMGRGMARPLRCGLGCAMNFQSRSVPKFSNHLFASLTLGTSSLPPASSNSTLTSGVSANRRATTEPEEPDPQTMKSYCGFKSDVSLCWLRRTRSTKSAATSGLRSQSLQFAFRVCALFIPCSLRLLGVRSGGTACCQRSTTSPGLLFDSQDDLPDLR